MKNKILTVRLSDELYNELTFKAKSLGISNSDYLRQSIKNKEIKHSNKKDISLLLGAVNKIGNNLNQIAYNLNIANKKNELNDYEYDNLLATLLLINENLKAIINEYK